MVDLTGSKFGKVTVTRLSHIKRYGKPHPQTKAYWACLCDCGNEKTIRGEHLTSGKINSCGCLHIGPIRHGMSKTGIYTVWASMKSRALGTDSMSEDKKKSYLDVSICKRWLLFENFYKDMGDRPSSKHEIDRIDPYGNYEPSNCRWVTHSENMLNKRKNHAFYKEFLTFDSVVSYSMYRQRVNTQGWSKIKAANTIKQKNQFC
jgi:hypothetical protein